MDQATSITRRGRESSPGVIKRKVDEARDRGLHPGDTQETKTHFDVVDEYDISNMEKVRLGLRYNQDDPDNNDAWSYVRDPQMWGGAGGNRPSQLKHATRGDAEVVIDPDTGDAYRCGDDLICVKYPAKHKREWQEGRDRECDDYSATDPDRLSDLYQEDPDRALEALDRIDRARAGEKGVVSPAVMALAAEYSKQIDPADEPRLRQLAEMARSRFNRDRASSPTNGMYYNPAAPQGRRGDVPAYMLDPDYIERLEESKRMSGRGRQIDWGGMVTEMAEREGFSTGVGDTGFTNAFQRRTGRGPGYKPKPK